MSTEPDKTTLEIYLRFNQMALKHGDQVRADGKLISEHIEELKAQIKGER